MFKVVENKNGTTTIYCSRSGKLMCHVPKTTVEKTPKATKQNNFKKNKRDGPKKVILPCSPKRKLSYASDKTEEPFKPRSPLPPEKDDFDLDCLDENTFFSFLNLAKPQLSTCTNFKEKLPLRRIATISSSPQSCSANFNDKIIEFSSNVGKEIITKNIKLQAKLPIDQPPYEKFCSLSSPLNSSLRNRDQITTFPVTYRTIRSNTRGYIHSYPFSQRDRKEKKISLQTGLNKDGRILKKKCKSLRINVKPLTIRDMINHNVTDHELLKRVFTRKNLHNELWWREIMSNVNKYIVHPNVILEPLEKYIVKKNSYFEVEGCQLLENDVRLIENNNQSFSGNKLKTKDIKNIHLLSPSRLRLSIGKVMNGLPLTKENETNSFCNNKTNNNINKEVRKPAFSLPTTPLKKIETPLTLPNNERGKLTNEPKQTSPKYGATAKTSNSYLPETNGIDDSKFAPPKPWKLLLPLTIESSKWNFKCYKCKICITFTDKQKATEQISLHMNKFHPSDPKHILQLCCLKHAKHNEVIIQAFSS